MTTNTTMHEHNAHVWDEPTEMLCHWHCVGHDGEAVAGVPAWGYLHCETLGKDCTQDGFLCEVCVTFMQADL